MAKKRKKKDIISPDELLFNFVDWTEPIKEDKKEESSKLSENSELSEVTEAPVPFKAAESTEPSLASKSTDSTEPAKTSVSSSRATDATSAPDLQYMEDSMFWAFRQIDGIDDKNQTRLIAMESASVVIAGVSLANIYQLRSFPYGRIDGYQLVALYYASFAGAFPNMLEGIKLPYAEQFKAAQKRFEEYIRR